MTKKAAYAKRCPMPKCGVAMDRWPHQCGRVTGHDGEHGPPNPFIIGDPAYGTLLCRVCGGDILADEPHRRVIRFWMLPGRGGWRRAFAHDLEVVASDGKQRPRHLRSVRRWRPPGLPGIMRLCLLRGHAGRR